MEESFTNFLNDRCIIRGDVRVSVSDIIGAYKIYSRDTDKYMIQSFRSFLRVHFENGLMTEYETGKPVYAIIGLKLIDVFVENKYEIYNEEEVFVNMRCDYSPRRKCIFENVLDEYIYWKRVNGLEFNRELDGNLLKEYLDNREEIVSGYIENYKGESGDGYYGLGLVSQGVMTKSRGRYEIEKRDLEENILVTYHDMFDATAYYSDGYITKNDMSKLIRHRTIIDGLHGEYYYRKKRSYFW